MKLPAHLANTLTAVLAPHSLMLVALWDWLIYSL